MDEAIAGFDIAHSAVLAARHLARAVVHEAAVARPCAALVC